MVGACGQKERVGMMEKLRSSSSIAREKLELLENYFFFSFFGGRSLRIARVDAGWGYDFCQNLKNRRRKAWNTRLIARFFAAAIQQQPSPPPSWSRKKFIANREKL